MTESQNHNHFTQNNPNRNQFYSMFNEPLPPTPSFRSPIQIPAGTISSPTTTTANLNMFIPSSPSTSNNNRQQQPVPSTSFNGNDNNDNNKPNNQIYNRQSNVVEDNNIVGPSDHYGMHHHNFNGNGSKISQNNDNTNQKTFLQHQSTLANQQRETKVCVIVDSRTPVIFTIPQPASKITLLDLKLALPAINKPNYKYFFKSNDSEFGIVKEEILDDDSVLPTYKNRIVAWIVTSNRLGDELGASSSKSITNRSNQTCTTDTCNLTYSNTSYDDEYNNSSSMMTTTDIDTTSYFTETDDDDSISCSNYSETTCDTFLSQRRSNNLRNQISSSNAHIIKNNSNNNLKSSPIHHHYNNNHHNQRQSQNSPYRYNTATNVSNNRIENNISTSSSSSSSATTLNSLSASQSDATAVHCLTVHLVLTNQNFLGLHIYANAINGIDEGIYVDGVTENSAVALDGRIEPGDKLIQVNDINLEELSNEEAVKILKEAVIKRGPLKLVVAKFVETNNNNNNGKNEPLGGIRDAIHPIDTAAWVEAHANAITSMPLESQDNHTANSATSSPSFGSHAQDTDCIRPSSVNNITTRLNFGLRLNRSTTDIKDIINHMKLPDIGLDIKDREWLKIHIPKAFLGSNLISWLERNVYGFNNNREVKKFASKMLKDGYIRDPLSKKSFSSKSYYIFVI